LERFASYELGGKAAPVYISEPETSPPLGVVVVVHEVWGLTPFIEYACRRLAQQGFRVAAPSLYWREEELFSTERVRQGLKLVWGLSLRDRYDPAKLGAALKRERASKETEKMLKTLYDKRFRARILRDLLLLARRLASQHPALRISAIGFSMGGRLAMELAAAFPALASCVTFSGSPVPGPTMWKIHCPTLMLYGSEDKFMLGELPSFIRDAKPRGELTVKIFPSAGHEFFDHTDEAYRAKASDSAWAELFGLLRWTSGSTASHSTLNK